jgi:DNA-directed RNA polymerase subunit M/transcription elongation factor TFIIS
MVKGDRKSHCGICNTLKIERKNRLVCPKCSRRYAIEHYHSKPKKILTEQQKARKKKHKSNIRPSGLTNQKVYAMKQRYGITEEEFVAIREIQKNKCPICSKELTSDALVDHCHTTGQIRGILCRKCNFAIGLLEDSQETLNRAILYLRKSISSSK